MENYDLLEGIVKDGIERAGSLRKYASRLNVSHGAVRKWLNHESFPDRERLSAIAQERGQTLADIEAQLTGTTDSDRNSVITFAEEVLNFVLSRIESPSAQQKLLAGINARYGKVETSAKPETASNISLARILKGTIPKGWQTPHQMWRELIPVRSATETPVSSGAIARIIEDGKERVGLIVEVNSFELKAKVVSEEGLSKKFYLSVGDRKQVPYPGQNELEIASQNFNSETEIQVKLENVFVFTFVP